MDLVFEIYNNDDNFLIYKTQINVDKNMNYFISPSYNPGIDFNSLFVVNMNIVVSFKVVDCRQVVSIMSEYILVNHTSRIATAVVE